MGVVVQLCCYGDLCRFLLERLLKYEKKKDVPVTKATGRSKPSVVQASPRQQLLPKQTSRQPPRTKPVVTPSRIPRQRSPESDESLSDHVTSPSPAVYLLPRKKPDRSLPKKIQAIPLKEDGKLYFTCCGCYHDYCRVSSLSNQFRWSASTQPGSCDPRPSVLPHGTLHTSSRLLQ